MIFGKVFYFIFLDLYLIYLSLAVCCYNNEFYIIYFFIYSYMTVCCYNNESKYAVGVGGMLRKGLWFIFFMCSALLVIIHVPKIQKWARGFTEPSRYNAVANVCNWKTSRRGNIFLCYFFGSIFYQHNVVGVTTYSIDTKMGGANVIALTRAF